MPPFVLTANERIRLAGIVANLSDFVGGARERYTFIGLAGLHKFRDGLNLDGSPRIAAGGLIEKLEQHGFLEERPTHHALGALCCYMHDQISELPQEDVRFVAELIVNYQLVDNQDYLDALTYKHQLVQKPTPLARIGKFSQHPTSINTQSVRITESIKDEASFKYPNLHIAQKQVPQLPSTLSLNSRLNRDQWLKSHGFIDNPFQVSAFDAQTDFIMDQPSMPAYVQTTAYQMMMNDQDFYKKTVFIFATSGGGKTNLRRWLCYKYDKQLMGQRDMMPYSKVLVVEYFDHEYDTNSCDPFSHAQRIAKLIVTKLQKLYGVEQPLFDATTSLDLLNSMIEFAQKISGAEYIWVLVDNIVNYFSSSHSVDPLFRIKQLTSHLNLLNIRELHFKFLLPLEVMTEAHQVLPLTRFPKYALHWQKDDLKEVLRQRLFTYMQPNHVNEFLLEAADVTLTEIVDVRLRQTIVDDMINISFKLGQPRIMWELGYYMLDQHFAQGNRLEEELIGRQTLLAALKILASREWLRMPIHSSDRVQSQFIEIRSELYSGYIVEAMNTLSAIPNTFAKLMAVRFDNVKRHLDFGIISPAEAESEQNIIISELLTTIES